MTSPYFLAISGNFKLIGYEPDGDSVRFIADNPARWNMLKNHFRIQPSKLDGSVQLRFDGIDATELHYGSQAQPLGPEARDRLLSLMGFTKITYEPLSATVKASNPQAVPTRVKTSTPATIPGFVLSQMAEINGRPVAYVLVGADAEGLRDGRWTNVTDVLLRRTLNAQILADGTVYITLYTSSPTQHQQILRDIARAARAAAQGVWARDSTAQFDLVDQSSISPPDGAVILPKLFRRATDYLKDVATKGFSGNLADWIRSVSASGTRNENDQVLVCGSLPVHLADLLEQRNKAVAFLVDPIEITFVEK